MRVISLNEIKGQIYYNHNYDDLVKPLSLYKEIYEAIRDGNACIRFNSGDREGSIGRLSFDPNYTPPKEPVIEGPIDRNKEYRIRHNTFFCRVTWDNRRNNIGISIIPYGIDADILIDYEGETIWHLFDAKKAKAEILKNPNQKDIKGRDISIGDRVLYINARYGSRMVLSEGKIVEFLASVNSEGHTISTVIESDNGEVSNLQYPEQMVYKMAKDDDNV